MSTLPLAQAVHGSVLAVAGEPREHAVNVHFFNVELKPDAKLTADQFAALVRLSKDGEFDTHIGLDQLAEGPSYIELGAWLGSQQISLEFMGLGAIFGFWDVITPGTLHVTGKQADDMAGMGFVMIAPKKGSSLWTSPSDSATPSTDSKSEPPKENPNS